jgi:hypothetical protein
MFQCFFQLKEKQLGLTTELKEKLTLKNSVIMGASSEMFLK